MPGINDGGLIAARGGGVAKVESGKFTVPRRVLGEMVSVAERFISENPGCVKSIPYGLDRV